jgi:hypothetical protein
MRTKRTEHVADAKASPLTWFAELWFARQSGDRDREATARRQLRERGVDVLIDESRLRHHVAVARRETVS